MSKNGNGTSLRSNQRKAIEALLSGMTKGQAAAAAGVQPATLSRWLSEDAFQNVLRQRSNDALEDAATQLKGMLEAALARLRDMLEDENTKPHHVLKAIDMTLSHATKITEYAELEERVKALEENRHGH